MKYIKRFETLSGQTDYLNSADIDTYVGYVDENETVYYDDALPVRYDKQYLTFVAEADNLTIGLEYADSNVFQYSTDSGFTWNNLTNNQSTSSVNSGETIMFKASGLTKIPYSGIGRLKPTANTRVEGNIMSLVYGDDFANKTSLAIDYQFNTLFSGCTGLTSAEHLILPATTLTNNCYSNMFNGCTSLTTAPSVLPATTLTNYCYQEMFRGCTSLTTAPSILPATTLAERCYQYMFQGCTNLTTAPELPATALASNCYSEMFTNCTSLTVASELPATTLASSCYSGMFNGCTSLTTAPELPATTLTGSCYANMFNGCTSLTTAPELPATALTRYCYYQMFYDCTSLNYIKCLATDISASSCTGYWVSGVASTGTFVKAASMNDWTTGNNGIPTGWTIENE